MHIVYSYGYLFNFCWHLKRKYNCPKEFVVEYMISVIWNDEWNSGRIFVEWIPLNSPKRSFMTFDRPFQGHSILLSSLCF